MVPFPAFMRRAEISGALSVWPVLRFARNRSHFPAFDSRPLSPDRVVAVVDAATREELYSVAATKCTLRCMLRWIFQS